MNITEELEKCGLSEEQYDECLQTILKKKNGDVDIDWSEICNQYKLPMSSVTLRKANGTIFGGYFVYEYLKYKKSLNNVDKPIEQINNQKSDNKIDEIKKHFGSEVSINKDGSFSSSKLLEMSENDSKDPNYLLQAHGFDNKLWKIVSARNTIRQVISKQDGVVTLYASYLTVKPLQDTEISFAQIEEIFDKLDRHYSIPVTKDNISYLQGDKLLLINIADLHMNLQSSLFTTGNKYDCDIAEQLFFYVINDVLTRTKNYQFEEIVFVIGSDMLNNDNIKNTTTKGTPQDCDIHYYDAYERCCDMLIKAIDILSQKAKVKVIYIPSNHDEQTGFKIAKFIDAWYRNDNSVNVDYTPIPRKYIKFGRTLLCFAHDANVKKLPMLIADEARKYWSDIDTTEVFLQHLHTENVVMEEFNMRIQRLPTISAKSKWTNDKGYSSKRQCKSFIFDIGNGLTDVLYTPVKMD